MTTQMTKYVWIHLIILPPHTHTLNASACTFRECFSFHLAHWKMFEFKTSSRPFETLQAFCKLKHLTDVLCRRCFKTPDVLWCKMFKVIKTSQRCLKKIKYKLYSLKHLQVVLRHPKDVSKTSSQLRGVLWCTLPPPPPTHTEYKYTYI